MLQRVMTQKTQSTNRHSFIALTPVAVVYRSKSLLVAFHSSCTEPFSDVVLPQSNNELGDTDLIQTD